MELTRAFGLAPCRVQDSSGAAAGGTGLSAGQRAVPTGADGEAVSESGPGAETSDFRTQDVPDPTGPKMIVSIIFSASWIWYNVEILPSNSATLSARRAQLTQSVEEVSGAIFCECYREPASAGGVSISLPAGAGYLRSLSCWAGHRRRGSAGGRSSWWCFGWFPVSLLASAGVSTPSSRSHTMILELFS